MISKLHEWNVSRPHEMSTDWQRLRRSGDSLLSSVDDYELLQ